MGFVTDIGWTDSTHNHWIGCAKVSRGCRLCYAEVLERRWHPTTDSRRRGADVWGRGPDSRRRLTAPANRRRPLAWNRQAATRRQPQRVFAFSLADVFDEHPMVAPWRTEFFNLVEATPWLRWMLLTHRIGNAAEMTKEQWGTDWPANVWLGATMEGQPETDERLPILLNLDGPAERFVSAEPLLEHVTTAPHLQLGKHPLSLLITGGESGTSAQAMHPAWPAALAAEAAAAGVPHFFKQWGQYTPYMPANPAAKSIWVNATTGKTMRSNFAPALDGIDGWKTMWNVSKRLSGRILDGRTHDGVITSWAAEMAAAGVYL